MMISTPEKHLTDQEFFTYIRFFDFIIERKNISDYKGGAFKLHHIGLGWYDISTIFAKINLTAQVLGTFVEVEKGDKFDQEIKEAQENTAKKPIKEKRRLQKILASVADGNKITIEDVAALSWVWIEIYYRIIFTPSEYKFPENIEKMMRMEMDKYLDNFINNKLLLSKKNYFRFELQKEALSKLLEENDKIRVYGSNFIIKEIIDNYGVLKRLPDFCIIHTVYAMQKLGYLKVLDVWEEHEKKDILSSFSGEEVGYINVNIALEEAFIDEITTRYKKKNPSVIFESFDKETGICKFAGEEIRLSRRGNQTDSVLLLTSLLKSDPTEWKHTDEILPDWGYHEDDLKSMPKNKVYHAALKINQLVALQTQIDDFIDCTTTKVRINPKYIKVDE